MTKRAVTLVSLCLSLSLAACGDADAPIDPLAPGSASSLTTQAAGDEIRDQIDALFPPPGLRNAARTQFRNIERQLDRGEEADAQQKTLDLVGFTLDKLASGQLLDPNGAADPTTEAAVAGLAADLYAFAGLTAPPVVEVHTEDGTVAVVGEGGGTVTTEDEFAGVDISDAATDETSVITIQRLDQDPCLPTGLPQYEGCYRFEKVPATAFLEEVTVGVCIDPAVADPDEDRLVLHKFDPDDPAAGVIPLEKVAAPFLDCAGFTVAAAESPRPWRLARAGLSRLADWLVPPLRATHTGAGGMTILFSDFGWVDPPELAFTANLDGNPDIYISDPAGPGFINLTNHQGIDLNPKWSPDTSFISFGSNRDGDAFEIYIMQADGTGVTRITTSPGHDLAHSWSAAGDTLAITSDRSGTRDIYLMQADGVGTPFLLAQHAGSPDISPDGLKVAYEGRVIVQADTLLDILVVNIDGTGATRVGNDPVGAARPAWSPDGTKIAFTSSRDGNAEIYVMNADGSNQVRLTNHPDVDVDPVWSPDGSMIAFQGRGQDTTEDGFVDISAIFVINADGSGLTRITRQPALYRMPDWKPAP